jgi:hypothetical protein
MPRRGRHHRRPSSGRDDQADQGTGPARGARRPPPRGRGEIVLNVARSVEEAELQASGKSIQELAAEEEAAAEFEIAELFDDIGGAQNDDEGDGREG